MASVDLHPNSNRGKLAFAQAKCRAAITPGMPPTENAVREQVIERIDQGLLDYYELRP